MPGQSWDFRAIVAEFGLYTESVKVDIGGVSDSGQRGGDSLTIEFLKLWNPREGWAKRKWEKRHGVKSR
jgi:hypothetical protein